MQSGARRGVALGGFMGTGKTTVGAALASRLALPFVDLDAVLAQRFGPIPDQFARDGEAAFRAREAALVAELCDGVPRVLATGGGAWASAENRARLRRHHRLVVLRAPLDVLARRVGEASGRPLWAGAATLLEARRDAYADAELSLDTADAPVEALVERIVEWLAAEEAAWSASR